MEPSAEEIRDRGCPCCGAAAGIKCGGAAAGIEPETGKHPAVKWMYVCFDRVEPPLSLL